MAAAIQFYQYRSARRDVENYRPRSPMRSLERGLKNQRFESVARNSYIQKDYSKLVRVLSIKKICDINSFSGYDY